MTEEAVKAFLEELSALTRKHRIEIGGCGCCGSPFLMEVNDGQVEGCNYKISVFQHASGAPLWMWEFLTWAEHDDEGNG